VIAAFCDEALDAVEAIAAGEVTAAGRIAEHLSTCPNCAAALASARALERMLRERPSPSAPAQFTARTLARVRRARWRSEQFLDVGFNLALALVIIAIVAGVWMLVRGTGLSAIGTDAVDIFGRGLTTLTRRVAPSLPLYAGAMAVVATALGIWWWAERDAAL
jgi:predicted anti-sigma-YlaC factor YlaD